MQLRMTPAQRESGERPTAGASISTARPAGSRRQALVIAIDVIAIVEFDDSVAASRAELLAHPRRSRRPR